MLRVRVTSQSFLTHEKAGTQTMPLTKNKVFQDELNEEQSKDLSKKITNARKATV